MTGYDMLPVGPMPSDAPTGPICGLHYQERRPAKIYHCMSTWPQGLMQILRICCQRGTEFWMCDECISRARVVADLREKEA